MAFKLNKESRGLPLEVGGAYFFVSGFALYRVIFPCSLTSLTYFFCWGLAGRRFSSISMSTLISISSSSSSSPFRNFISMSSSSTFFFIFLPDSSSFKVYSWSSSISSALEIISFHQALVSLS